jgi:hypothetical protein
VISPFSSLFVLFSPSKDWMRLNYIEESNIFLSNLLIQMLISSRNTLTDKPQKLFNGTPVVQSISHKINQNTFKKVYISICHMNIIEYIGFPYNLQEMWKSAELMTL